MIYKMKIDNTEMIINTGIKDVKLRDEIIATVCEYCGAPMSIHKETKYEDRDEYTVEHIYCPNQCDGVKAEYEKEQETIEALREIQIKYQDRLKPKYNDSEVLVNAINNHIESLNKEHEEKISNINKHLDKAVTEWNRYLYVKKRYGGK